LGVLAAGPIPMMSALVRKVKGWLEAAVDVSIKKSSELHNLLWLKLSKRVKFSRQGK
jgi:hypothetical protein